jgi:RIP homotypic interaction motif
VQPFIRNIAAFLLLTILISMTPTPASYALSGLALIPFIGILIAAPRILQVILRLMGNRGKTLWNVHVTDSKGIQVGDENTQVNSYEAVQ